VRVHAIDPDLSAHGRRHSLRVTRHERDVRDAGCTKAVAETLGAGAETVAHQDRCRDAIVDDDDDFRVPGRRLGVR
jgi:hypothetical protein